MIAAIGKNRGLGKDNKLLWKIPEDFKRYVALTVGHTLIMGRKTYDSIGRPLPRRTNIIVTRDQNFQAAGCIICHSLDDALVEAKKVEANPHPPFGHLPPSADAKALADKEGEGKSLEIFINGGAQIYEQALPLADKLYLTVVDQEAEADAFFPAYEDQFKKITFRQDDEFNGLRYSFLELERE